MSSTNLSESSGKSHPTTSTPPTDWKPPPPLYKPGFVGAVPGYEHTPIVPHDCPHVHSVIREWLTNKQAGKFTQQNSEISSTTSCPPLKRKSSASEHQTDREKKRRLSDSVTETPRPQRGLKAIYPSSSSFGCLSNPNIPRPTGFNAHRIARLNKKRATPQLLTVTDEEVVQNNSATLPPRKKSNCILA